jgi:methionyl-tRNA formyltransferase
MIYATWREGDVDSEFSQLRPDRDRGVCQRPGGTVFVLMRPLRIIFAGSGEFGLPALRAIRTAGHSVVLVVSQPDKPAGRGNRLTPTAVSQYALAEHLPLLRTGDINAERLPEADMLVVIAFGQKIAPHIVEHPRLGSINLHASRLPKLRGAAPINWAILRGEARTGNSVIRLAQKMDAGAILAQSLVPIGELETAGELHDRLAEDGGPLMVEALGALAAGSATETEQDHSGATLAPKLSRETAKLDWSQAADGIARQVRGLYPWPGCRVRVIAADGAELNRVTLARAGAALSGAGAPGTILADGTIATGNGAVEIFDLTPEGKRLMPLAAYRNGHPWPCGARVESV